MPIKKRLFYIFGFIRIILYIALVLFFVFFSFNFITSGPECIIHKTTGLFCPACGVTRAFYYFCHFNFGKAFYYHGFFTLFVFPVFFIIALQDIFIVIKRSIMKSERLSFFEYLFAPSLYLKNKNIERN